MSVTVIRPGNTYVLDPAETRSLVFDWDLKNLRSGITIATSTFTITTIQQGGATILTKDSASILNGANATIACERTVGDSRVTQVRLIGTTATDGDEYELANTILTSETPAQTKEQSIRILVQHR